MNDSPIAIIKGNANRDFFNTVTYRLYEDKVTCSSNHNGENVLQTLPLSNLHTISSVTGVNRLKIVGYIVLILCYGLGLVLLIIYLCRAKNMITLNDRVALRYRNKEEGQKFIDAVLEQQNKLLKK